MSRLPRLVAHADWSAGRKGRAVVVAEARPSGGWWLAWLEPERAFELLETPGALVGVDAPIGLPRPYGKARGIGDFRAFLAALDPADPFFEPVAPPDRPSLDRPFYPRRPGGARRAHLVEGLGIERFSALLRRCDRLARASCLFWTLGPEQCGRAALALWRDLLMPRLDRLALWPFDGPLDALGGRGGPVVAETYPGLAYRLLGLERGFGKARLEGRLRQAGRLSALAGALDARLAPPLADELSRGFPQTRDHGFDAFAGCLLLLAVATGRLPSGEPPADPSLAVEGWMLGLVEGAAGQAHQVPVFGIDTQGS